MWTRRALLLAGIALAGTGAARAASSAEWFYAYGARVIGPETLEVVRETVSQGFIRKTTQVYVERNGWRPAVDHPELADLFAGEPDSVSGPTPPDPAQGEAAAAYLIGSWSDVRETSYAGVYYRAERETVFASDLTLTGTSQYHDGAGKPAATVTFKGSWTVRAGLNARFFVLEEIVEIDGLAEKSKATYQIVDDNTIYEHAGKTLRRRKH